MPSIHNKTKLPLAVPLPGGKKLRLGPFQTGQVTPKALEFPPLVKLIEAGQIELSIEGQKRGDASLGTKGPSQGRHNAGGGGAPRHTGDR